MSEPGLEDAITRVSKFTQARQFLESIPGKVDKALEDHSRTFIMYCVTLAYFIVVLTSATYLVLRGGDKTFDQLLDLIKTAIIPIITLVIGYYFGSKKA